MKYVLWAVGVMAAAGVVVAVCGWLLPVGHVASRTATFNRSPADVYAAVSDVAQYATWRSDVTRVEILDRRDGRVRFREHSTTGPIIMEIAEATPPRRMVTRIADPDQPFGGTWTFEITQTATGAALTITERGEVYNPIFRFVARFVFGHTATMQKYLGALQVKLRR